MESSPQYQAILEKKVTACLLLLHTHNNIQWLQTCDISGIALYCADILFIEEETYSFYVACISGDTEWQYANTCTWAVNKILSI